MDNVNAQPKQYLRNPDVVLREEDEDGGLLFNPDTNVVKLINTTGLFIWKECNCARRMDEIVTVLRDTFDDVPEEQVTQDVKEFIDYMVGAGFLGIAELSASDK
jgi:hypothetical protein